MTENKTPKKGDLCVAHFPQVPCKPFRVDVASVDEGLAVMDLLAEYDLFQLSRSIKPDYTSAAVLEVYEEIDEGKLGWATWYDDESGEDSDGIRPILAEEGVTYAEYRQRIDAAARARSGR